LKPIIKVENLSKQYRLGTIGTGTLRQDVSRWMHKIRGREDPYLKIGETNDRGSKGESDYVWALKDINFEVMPGEVLGIIGKNGAGKSTLLKILSKVTGPTTGRIDYNGRIGSLLEVGTGFHPELTGRENIFLNGAILGMTKHEIRSKLDEIIDFSGCERYIDTPVKRYSSGMTVRLGFAVAAHLEPEILVVDEVLAVGDAEFQKKALGKMQDVSKNDGRTVLFVSHNMAAVKNICEKGILLEHGTVKCTGLIDDVIENYINSTKKREEVYFPLGGIVKCISARQDGPVIILSLTYHAESPIKQPNFGFIIYDSYENPLFGNNPLINSINDFGSPRHQGEVQVKITSPFLINGTYSISIWFSDGVAVGDHLFKKENCISINITDMDISRIENTPHLGNIIPICNWQFN
jgi:ABC-type polysaccharide/polyol phosphate transport system ATPase subunit